MTPILSIDNLTKHYKNGERNVLNGLTFSVNPGEIYGFLGPNGAGKSTTIKILSGLIPSDGGNITVLGKNLHNYREQLKRSIGVVPQDIAIFPTLTAYENLIVFGGIYGLQTRHLYKRIRYLLKLFGLDEHRNKKVELYSGGMKRRINIIVGMLHEPSLLLLDEPTVGIDVQSKNVIIENLKMLNSKGTTILYTSHDMDEAQQFCTKVGIIDEGEIIKEGTPEELISQFPGCSNLEAVYLKLTGKKLRD
jgi:ABC-2 type transport system ATP-binding protein